MSKDDTIKRYIGYLKNALAPIYECSDCGSRNETFLSIEKCYKCESTNIIKYFCVDKPGWKDKKTKDENWVLSYINHETLNDEIKNQIGEDGSCLGGMKDIMPLKDIQEPTAHQNPLTRSFVLPLGVGDEEQNAIFIIDEVLKELDEKTKRRIITFFKMKYY
jgi:hypothetical protein